MNNQVPRNNRAPLSQGQKVYSLNPIITEKQVWREGNILLAFLLGIVFVLIDVSSIVFLGLTTLAASILGFALVVIYAIALFFLLEPRLIKEIKRTEIMVKDRPVLKEVVRTVEKEVPTEVVRTVERIVPRTVYIEKKRKKLNIPKYAYVGSTLTKIVHKKSCRFGKSIKRKYKLNSNNLQMFKKKKYQPCELCMKRKSPKIKIIKIPKNKVVPIKKRVMPIKNKVVPIKKRVMPIKNKVVVKKK